MPAPLLTALIPILGSIGGQVAKSLFPDPADAHKAKELEVQLQLAVLQQSNALEQAAGDIIKAEASSQHWLAATWRPVLMLTFGGLIVARWFGWTAPGMTEAEYLSIYDLLKIGIGGYIIGRSAEKIAPQIAAARAK